MFVTGVLLLLSTVLLASLFIWRRRHYSYFERLGIPGPKPNLIWGNLREYHSKEAYKAITKWLDQYGDVFGFYNGDVPFVVLRDLNFIKYVFVSNFQNFVNRGLTMMTDQMHPILKKSIMHVGGSQWKSIRTCVVQGMTAAKLKQLRKRKYCRRTVPFNATFDNDKDLDKASREYLAWNGTVENTARQYVINTYMMPHIEEDAGIFIKSLEEYADSGKEVHMLRKLEELSMDYVARGSFGIDEHFQGKPDHPFMVIAKSTVRGLMTGPFHMIAQCTTTLGMLMKPFYWLSLVLGEYTFEDLNLQTEKVVQLRKNDPTLRKPDILQNLIDAEYVEAENDGGDKEASNEGLKRRALTVEEVITSASVLFVAGFETTATGLSYVFFALAKHPDIQEKVRQEVIDTVGVSGSLDYETVMKKLKYLHCVVDEALRLYPPGLTFVTRQAKEDFEYNGTKFKAGTCFMAAQYQTQIDPRYWTKPLDFNPDRFTPENKTPETKAANIPFGVGPRNCVGKRLALLKIRYTVARLLQKYRLELGPSQMGSMEMSQYAMVSTPSRGPWILINSLAEECRGS